MVNALEFCQLFFGVHVAQAAQVELFEMEETNEAKQDEEIEALVAIYGDDISIQPSVKCKSLELNVDQVTLRVTLPSDYPLDSTPKYEISAPFLSREQKEDLDLELVKIISASQGDVVVFALVECLKDFLEQIPDKSKKVYNVDIVQVERDLEKCRLPSVECPEITTGDCIEDRKSVFQGHYAKVERVEEVKSVIAKLYENRKIANATHNMYAYRIKQQGGKVYLQDCDDDGETHAGSRMLHLLEILNCENVLVVVTRWYGGIQLGPDRFKHINNAARSVLDQAGVLPGNTSTSSKKDAKANKSSKKK